MAISTDAAIEFFGTQDTLTTSTSQVLDGGFSGVGDLASPPWLNDDDAPMASVVFAGAYATAPTPGTSIALFARLMDVQGANDQGVPDSNYGHVFLGAFPLNDVGGATTQYVAIDVGLPNTKTSQGYEFYIQNNAGNTLNSGWNLYITPKTIGPHP